MQDLAELAGLEALAQLDHGRFEAALVTDAKGDAGLFDGSNRAPDVLASQAQGFFAKHVLAGACRLLDLLGMEAVRGA